MLFEGRSAASGASLASMVGSLDWPTAAALVLTGMVAAALGRAYAQCYKVASATAVCVAGNVNRMLAILLSVAFFGSRSTPTQLAGMLLCLGAACAFSVAGVRAARKAKDA